jgi:pilus assembly protein CpaB
VVNAVTLELTPDQAERLDLARSVGTLSLVLRNQIDPTPVNTEGATKTRLLDVKLVELAPKLAGAPKPRPAVKRGVVTVVVPATTHQVDIIKGLERTTQLF